MSETKSRSSYWLEARHKCILPIFDASNSKPSGVLSIIKVKKLHEDDFSDISIL